MNKEKMIPANDFCAHHHLEISFISSLQETGLLEMTVLEETGYIPVSQLKQLEKIVRLYHDLDINLEGIDTITHLLRQITDMKDEITELRNRLRLYEDDF